MKGFFVDNVKQSLWEERYENGDVFIGNYKNNQRNGDWVLKYADGEECIGQCANDMRQGRWTIQNEHMTQVGSFLNDKREFLWEFRYKNGSIASG